MKNLTLFQGAPVALAGTFVTAGMKAPDFRLVKGDLSNFTLADGRGRKLLLNIFPSVDTPVCSASVRKFNEMAAGLDDVSVLCISKDLPFAQGRFCAAEGIGNVITLSDFQYDSEFGRDYGVLMTDGPLRGLLARAVVVVDANGKITYSRMSPDIVQEPDYEEALAALKRA